MELTGLFRVIDEFRKLDPELPSQTIQTFLFVCAHDPAPQRDIADALCLAPSTVSRNLAALSKVHRLGKPGLDLVRSQEDPQERRRKMIYLTAKGRKLRSDLVNILGKGA